jgi:uncharacterized membrane protein
MLNALLGALTLGYPFAVYFSLGQAQPRYLALLLAGLFLLRWLRLGQPAGPAGSLAILAPASALFLLAVSFANDTALLMSYPIFVNGLFFSLFFYTLRHPPSLVEKLARLREPELAPPVVAYTRKVTQAWCVFFLGNGWLAALTVWLGDPWVWWIYNGCIAYGLMGLLMGGEMLIRRSVKRSLGMRHAGK